jgi:hypothetical protein
MRLVAPARTSAAKNAGGWLPTKQGVIKPSHALDDFAHSVQRTAPSRQKNPPKARRRDRKVYHPCLCCNKKTPSLGLLFNLSSRRQCLKQCTVGVITSNKTNKRKQKQKRNRDMATGNVTHISKIFRDLYDTQGGGGGWIYWRVPMDWNHLAPTGTLAQPSNLSCV